MEAILMEKSMYAWKVWIIMSFILIKGCKLDDSGAKASSDRTKCVSTCPSGEF